VEKGYYYRILLVIFPLAILFSCENSDPGCLDLLAENYDVFAVSECDSCCVFPDANINLAFEYDTIENFTFNTLYPYEGTDSILISNFQLPIHQFTFYSDGSAYKIIDTIRGQVPRIYDDYILKEKSSANIVIGQTNFVAEIDSVSFSIGLEESGTLALRPYENVEQQSKFIAVVDEMYVDSIPQLFQARIELEIADSLRKLELHAIASPQLGFSISESLSPGVSWTIPLDIDLRMAIDGIKAEDSNEVMSTTISNNISKSFLNR